MGQISHLEHCHSFKIVSSSAGLQLLAKHAFQFSSCFMDHYRTLFEVMSKLCGHINPEMKKTSSYALEAFLKQVKTFSSLSFNIMIQVFFLMFMMSQYCLMVMSLTGIHKELSKPVCLHLNVRYLINFPLYVPLYLL